MSIFSTKTIHSMNKQLDRKLQKNVMPRSNHFDFTKSLVSYHEERGKYSTHYKAESTQLRKKLADLFTFGFLKTSEICQETKRLKLYS